MSPLDSGGDSGETRTAPFDIVSLYLFNTFCIGFSVKVTTCPEFRIGSYFAPASDTSSVRVLTLSFNSSARFSLFRPSFCASCNACGFVSANLTVSWFNPVVFAIPYLNVGATPDNTFPAIGMPAGIAVPRPGEKAFSSPCSSLYPVSMP